LGGTASTPSRPSVTPRRRTRHKRTTAGPRPLRVQEALFDAGVADLARPTLNDGESYQQLLADPSSFETYNIDAARTKGYGYARIQRYAIEHLLGVR
jgi:hypothetical protein